MKLKEKVSIDVNGKPLEVKGGNIKYTSDDINLDLIVHESRDAWLTGTLDISEKSTGCRICSSNIEVSKISEKDIIQLVQQEIKNRGADSFRKRIEYMLDKTMKI